MTTIEPVQPPAAGGDYPCTVLRDRIKGGRLFTREGVLIPTQAKLGELTGISETKLSSAIRDGRKMFTAVQDRQGKKRWELICEITGLSPSELFPQLPFERPECHYTTFVNPGEVRKLLIPAGATRIEIQATHDIWVRLDGLPPSPETGVGFRIAGGVIQSLSTSSRDAHVATPRKAELTHINYRWMR